MKPCTSVYVVAVGGTMMKNESRLSKYFIDFEKSIRIILFKNLEVIGKNE